MNDASPDIDDRFRLHFDAAQSRRKVAGAEMIIHCHHYNARLQRTIEGAAKVDGRSIFVSSAEAAFVGPLRTSVCGGEDEVARWEVARRLYAHLGYGTFGVEQLSEGIIEADASHFVEGWRAGFGIASQPVCSLTCGYLQAAHFVATGRLAHVREESCRLQGADRCRFVVDDSRTEPLCEPPPSGGHHPVSPAVESLASSIDERAIIDAVVGMPIQGNEHGLIPAFNVYLANTPADFYNEVCIRFIEEMTAVRQGSIARDQLIQVAETCAMNTFRGILDSAEWDALVAPMIRAPEDRLFGLIAVSNALGWGDWHVQEHAGDQTLILSSANGYEASGYAKMRGDAHSPRCLMLTGVSAGVMELLYGEGPFEDRYGQFFTDERACRCAGSERCTFQVEAA